VSAPQRACWHYPQIARGEIKKLSRMKIPLDFKQTALAALETKRPRNKARKKP
jgi:hypothetical protein